MQTQSENLAIVERLAADLDTRRLEPVLVGGMALVILGSQRITKDYDFLISSPSKTEDVVRILYSNGLELVTKLGEDGNVQRTVDREKVAVIKVTGTRPKSLFFYRAKGRLRVDLLFDFPIPAHEVSARAVPVTFLDRKVKVAAPEDLLRMKETARQERNIPSDLQDIEFLKSLLARRRPS